MRSVVVVIHPPTVDHPAGLCQAQEQFAVQQLASLDVVDHIIASDDFQGCIFVNAAMEFPLPHEPAHVAACENKQAIEDNLHKLAVEAGADGPRELALELCLIMEGAYVTRQVTGNKQTIDIARRISSLVVGARFPGS